MRTLPRTASLGLGASLALASAVGCTTLSIDPEQETGSGSVSPADCTPRESPLIALGGTILTPEGPVQGYVVVAGERIASIALTREAIPAGATVVDTNGIISPGLIDLHNHVNYDFLPLWQSGRTYANRFEWAGRGIEGEPNYMPPDPGYLQTVKAPYDAVKTAKHMCQAVKYGEFRALVGGTTAIQGSSDLACTRAWVRNVENVNFCEDHVGQHGGSLSFLDADEIPPLLAQFEDHSMRAFLIHLSEGVDEMSRHEFDELRTMGLVRPEVVLIHGTALGDAEFEEMGRVGMKLVWSPTSNLLLYGQTTDVATALSHGVMVSLAPDWTPSGTANVLAELKVADRVDRERFDDVIDDQTMFRMVTSNPADTLGMQDKIGRIAPGLYADLVVIRGDTANPYRALIDASPVDVLATFVSGEPLYGELRLLDALGKAGQYQTIPAELACGEERGIDVQLEDSAIVGGRDTLDAVIQTLETDTAQPVVPLIDCGAAPTTQGN